MNSKELLDALKKHSGVPSDYALARDVLKVDPNSLREMRERGLSDERAIQIATLLEINVGEALAAIHAERAKTPAAKRAWLEVAKSLRQSAAAVLVALFGLGVTAPEPAQAAQGSSSVYYVKRRRRIVWTASTAGIAAFSALPAGAFADDGDWSLQINGTSWHAKSSIDEPYYTWNASTGQYELATRKKRFNQENTGFGIEYEQQLDADWNVLWNAGSLANSMGDQSFYAGGALTRRWSARFNIDAGMFLGALSYPSYRETPFPVALPMLAIGTRRAGVNLILIPPVDGIPLALLAQARIGF